jgi:hypothetical protein
VCPVALDVEGATSVRINYEIWFGSENWEENPVGLMGRASSEGGDRGGSNQLVMVGNSS